MRESLGSVMESNNEANSTLASFRTFQFLCARRSSHGSFFASFNNLSSSDDIAVRTQTLLISANTHRILERETRERGFAFCFVCGRCSAGKREEEIIIKTKKEKEREIEIAFYL